MAKGERGRGEGMVEHCCVESRCEKLLEVHYIPFVAARVGSEWMGFI